MEHLKMGKGKPSKKTKEPEKKPNRVSTPDRVSTWLTENSVTTEDLLMAGLGVAARSARKGKRKPFKRASKSGRRLVADGFPAFANIANASTDSDKPMSSEPVISYQHNGGGWYSVEVGGFEVDRVQGEESAAERAGSLLAAYASLDSESQQSRSTGVDHVGGGWYEVTVAGVPVDRVRGKSAVAEQYPQLVSYPHVSRSARQ